MPHLTCVASSEADIRSLLDDYRALGIYRLMALRGDMPSGALENAGFTTAQQLVAYVRELWGNNARIFVAAYPEVHPRAHTPAADLQAFRDKVAAGATDAVTQYFYNVEAFLRFRDEALALGIDVPIVPCIMPISNFNQLSRFSDACGAEIPRWLRKRLEALQDDLPALCDYGADVVAGICERLIAEGVPAPAASRVSPPPTRYIVPPCRRAVVGRVVAGPRTRRATAAVTIFMFEAGVRAASGSCSAMVFPVAASTTLTLTWPVTRGSEANDVTALPTAAESGCGAFAFHAGRRGGPVIARETVGYGWGSGSRSRTVRNPGVRS